MTLSMVRQTAPHLFQREATQKGGHIPPAGGWLGGGGWHFHPTDKVRCRLGWNEEFLSCGRSRLLGGLAAGPVGLGFQAADQPLDALQFAGGRLLVGAEFGRQGDGAGRQGGGAAVEF